MSVSISANSEEETFLALDPRQLIKIESIHRGFFYQHLYAAGILLLAGKGGADAVVIERDEDIEIVCGGTRYYIQVKTRSEAITPGDIAGALDRFEEIRKEHASGKRKGKAAFVIVINNAPGPKLSGQIEKNEIATDVSIMWPGSKVNQNERLLPPAWSDIGQGMAWCRKLASELPFSLLQPETLVSKLTGCVLRAAAGDEAFPDHTFLIVGLPELFEQLVIQLHEFPNPPSIYRPQEDEPDIDSKERIRIISGLSGAGKTAWASQAALYSSDDYIYFDVGDIPGPAIPAALVREIAARRTQNDPAEMRKLLMPGAGTESLALLDSFLKQRGFNVTIFLDNSHRVPSADMRLLIESTKQIRFVLMCQPTDSVQELEALLVLKREELKGWGLDAIASEVHAHGAIADAETCDKLRTLTGGLPLFVQSAARLAVTGYNNSVQELCVAVEHQTHLTPIAQEIILRRLFQEQSEAVRAAVSALSLSDVALKHSEVSAYLGRALDMTPAAVATIIRTLNPSGVLQTFGADELKIHDGIRVLGLGHFETLNDAAKTKTYEALRDVLMYSLLQHHELARFPLFFRVLVKLGDIKTLVFLASEEWFHELGIGAEVWPTLEQAVGSEDTDPVQRYWGLDGLVFRDLRPGEFKKKDPELIRVRLTVMEQLITENNLGTDERTGLLMKQMLFEAQVGNEDKVLESIPKIAALVPDKPDYQRIFQYNVAAAMWSLEHFELARQISRPLIDEYYAALGLKEENVINKNPDEILPLIKQTETTQDDLKHLADALDLCSRVTPTRDRVLMRFHSMKFYQMSNAVNSMVVIGQEVVQDFLDRHDFTGARMVMEKVLLPAIRQLKLIRHMVRVRSFYAIVLAYCGDSESAEAEMQRLEPYVAGLPEEQQKEIAEQTKIIARLKISRPLERSPFERPLKPILSAAPMPARKKRKIGPNERCPCGSNKKYKKCHGRGIW